MRHYGLVREPANLEVYAPLEQLPIWFRNRRPNMTLFARTALEPEQLAASIRQAVSGIDRDIPVFCVQTMEGYVAQATEQSRLNMTLLALFGGLALVLSSLGIYGVLSYLVSRRTQEIGIRMALGATRGDVMRLIVGHGMALTATGIAIGLAASWAITRSLSSAAGRRLAARSGHVRGDRAPARGDRLRRELPARPARDARRSDDHAAGRIRRNRGAAEIRRDKPSESAYCGTI